MCRIFLGLCVLTAVARCNPTSLQTVRTARCVTPDVASQETIFGIDVYAVLKHPVVPIPRKRMCISAEPNIDIRIGVHHFNLLNATVSPSACRDVYHKLICNRTKTVIENECMYAIQIMFAAMQRAVECETDLDCTGIRMTYDFKAVWCDWSLQTSKHVCHTPLQALALNACKPDGRKGTRIRDACRFMNPACAFIVDNINFLAPISGVSLFLISFSIIFLSHL